jgi:F-type H+-transporting ATPase subunit alpha
MEGTIYTAYPMDDATVARIAAQFAEKLGRAVTLKQVVDKRILAGFIVRIGFLRFDYSVGARLKEMMRHMLNEPS